MKLPENVSIRIYNNDYICGNLQRMKRETDYIACVEQFHKTFNQPVLETPQIPDEKRCELRVRLLQEELDEFKEAIANNDLVEVADALSDIMYVLSGAIIEFGLKDQFETLFNEVQRSNMSKACNSMDIAEKTVAHYKAQGTASEIRESNGKFNVYRKPDNKVLKSVEYSPADLKTILKDYL